MTVPGPDEPTPRPTGRPGPGLAWAPEPGDADGAPADDAAPAASSYRPRRHDRQRAAGTRGPTPPAAGSAPAAPPPPRRARTALRALSTVMLAAGTLLVADAAATVTWEEPITALLSQRGQRELGADLARLQTTGPSRVERRALATIEDPTRRLAFLSRSLKRRTDDGEATARLRMPRLGASDVVVMGTQPDDLRKGPGFYASNPLPGAPGTVAIAGHRTTYGAPFRHVDRLRRGDELQLVMPYATFTYAVERTRIVAPSEVSVLERRRTDRLVLTACHPLFSAAQRIVVSARLVRTRVRSRVARGPSTVQAGSTPLKRTGTGPDRR